MRFKNSTLFIIFLLALASTAANVPSGAIAADGDSKYKTAIMAYSTVESFPDTVGAGENIADPPGISVELIKQAAENCGIKVRFVRLPNVRVLRHLENGEVDGAFLYSFKKERETCGLYPMKNGLPDGERKLTSHGYYVYKKKDSPLEWNGTKFLNGGDGTIGVNLGYSIANDIRNMGAKVEESITTEQNLKKLESGRIAAYVTENTFVVDNYIIKEKSSGIMRVPIPFVEPKDYFLLFSRNYAEKFPDKVEIIWNEIAKIRESKTEEMLHKYLQTLK